MGQTTRSEWESDMRAHRELLRNVIEEHREGRDSIANMGELMDELALPEEIVYAPISTLASSNPPMMAQGPSGWIYHSNSLGCLRPHHFPRRVAINIVESGPFDPLILVTIMANCFTMGWSSPMDVGDPSLEWKAELLGVRTTHSHPRRDQLWRARTRAARAPPRTWAAPGRRTARIAAPHAAPRPGVHSHWPLVGSKTGIAGAPRAPTPHVGLCVSWCVSPDMRRCASGSSSTSSLLSS